MLEDIKNIPKQFSYKPKIVNRRKLKSSKEYILIGMGGSHLSADILKAYDPSLHMHVRRNYGLPVMPLNRLKQHTIIANSYSGNTEEVLDAYRKAIKLKLNSVAIATGGKLLGLAKKHGLAYIQMPKTGIQPRLALGFNLIAILKAVGHNEEIREVEKLSRSLRPVALQKRGQKLAKVLKNHTPVIYASTENMTLAYNWKIKFNETGKIPAFYNVFPEHNHNELNGFDVVAKTRDLSKSLYFIFIEDANDHKRVIKRMQVVKKLYKKKNLKFISIKLSGQNLWQRMFANLILADWTAYYTSQLYGRDASPVLMIESLKKMI